MKRTGVRRVLAWSCGILAVVVGGGVWVSHQFPAWTHGPKTSVEILEAVFTAPVRAGKGASSRVVGQAERDAMELFLYSCDLPADSRRRLVAFVRGEQFREVTVPFVFYLYGTYGPPAAGSIDASDLAYAESPPAEAAGEARPGLSGLVQKSVRLRKHVSLSLRAFDALFLQVDSEAARRGAPLHQRYDPASYERVKALVREMADDFVKASSDGPQKASESEQYKAMLQGILADEKKLSAFVEFFTNLVRQLSDGWLESYTARQQRKEARLAWVDACLASNRLYEIADYARARARRRMAVHIVVDGLQGKLLEGIAQLSSGNATGSGAQYVGELVRTHQAAAMDPAAYGAKLPRALGGDLERLLRNPADRPERLPNFKRCVFGPGAEAVWVNVATVDTPTISARNLQVVKSGHPVAGPFGTGIPNFNYLDRRTERSWYFWGSDALEIGRIFANREDEIPLALKRDGPGAQTPFERLWRYNTLACMPTVDAGALEKLSTDVGFAVGMLQRNYPEKLLVVNLRRRAAMEDQLNERRAWLAAHRTLSHSFLGSLVGQAANLKRFHEAARFIAEHEDEGLPDYLLWYSPWLDHYAHGEGPFSDAILGERGELERLDFYLGKVVDVYESVRDPADDSTCASRTLFGLVSDHGMTYTPRLVSTEDLLLRAMQADGLRVQYRKVSADEGELPIVHSRNELSPTRPFDALFGCTAGGSCVLDLFQSEGLRGDDAAWRRHPDYHQLKAGRLLGGQAVDWIEQLKRRFRGAMDLALVREYGPKLGEAWPAQVDSVVRIVTPDRGEARIWRMRRGGAADRPSVRYRYEKIDGKDPLELLDSVRDYLLPRGGLSAAAARDEIRRCIDAPDGCDDAAWRQALSYTLRADSIYQLSHLYDTDRAGTVNVFPLRGVGFNSAVAGRHAGETFEEKNGTQLYFGAGLKRASLQTARNGSLAVTLYHWLAGDAAFHAVDAQSGASPAQQFGFPSLLHEPAFSP